VRGANGRRVRRHGHGVQTLPSVVGQADRGEAAIDLERGEELIERQLCGVGGRKHIVELVKVWLGKVLFAGQDKLVGTELERVVLLAVRVGEDDDLGSERLGELDGKV
jgi:hypothetical protein